MSTSDEAGTKGTATDILPVKGDSDISEVNADDFQTWRENLTKIRSGQRLLDAILEPKNAREMVSRLSVDDFHYMVHRIGMEDSEQVLALAAGEQVRGLLDCDGWSRDQIEMDRLDPWLNALMRSGPEHLTRHLLALDDVMLTYILTQSCRVKVIDEPDDFDPPDVEHTFTPDGRLCIMFPESAARDLPIKVFLDYMTRRNPVFCFNLLVMSIPALRSNLEEEAYRWRSGRMADLGYVDYYDALNIYVPPRRDSAPAEKHSLPQDAPIAFHWLDVVQRGQKRLKAALATQSSIEAEEVQAAIAVAANMMLSADRVERWDEKLHKQVLTRLRTGIVLGLEEKAGMQGDPHSDALLLRSLGAPTLFRIGYGVMLDAVKPLRNAIKKRYFADPESAFGGFDITSLRPWFDALATGHPKMDDGEPPRDRDQLEKIGRMAKVLAEFGEAAGGDRPLEVGLSAWLMTDFIRMALGISEPGSLPGERYPEAHVFLFEHRRLRSEAKEAAAFWWKERGGRADEALEFLLGALEKELAHSSPSTLDVGVLNQLWVSIPSELGE